MTDRQRVEAELAMHEASEVFIEVKPRHTAALHKFKEVGEELRVAHRAGDITDEEFEQRLNAAQAEYKQVHTEYRQAKKALRHARAKFRHIRATTGYESVMATLTEGLESGNVSQAEFDERAAEARETFGIGDGDVTVTPDTVTTVGDMGAPGVIT